MRWIICAVAVVVMALPPILDGQDASPGKPASPGVKTPRARVSPRPAPTRQSLRYAPHPNPKPAGNQPITFSEALHRWHHERHDQSWWKQHHFIIVIVGGGCYYWDAGYWFPAWGYDPSYQSYDYDGPIYTYGNLLPDQVIANVQRALKELGYYNGNVTGSLGPSSRQALSAYQEDYGLDVTGAIDEPTIQSLGLY